MTEREVTRYETVEKTDTVKVCDSCGTDESEIPDDAGEFHTVYEDLEVTAERTRDYIDRTRLSAELGVNARAYITGTANHLCPICYGATLGGD